MPGLISSDLVILSSAHLDAQELAQWHTSTRLLASLLNDSLINSTPHICPYHDGSVGLLLHGKEQDDSSPAAWIGLSRAGMRLLHEEARGCAIFPGDFAPPLLSTQRAATLETSRLEYSPSAMMHHLRSSFDVEPVADELFNTICDELTNCTQNGRHWIEWYKAQKPLTLKSSMIQWEQALYTGHPLHPMHRTLSAAEPMSPIPPEKISSLMTHSISFISVPGSDVRISGPYRQALKPLLLAYGLEDNRPGRIIIPCITMQIPVIQQHHADVEVLIQDAFQTSTQSSLRTISIPLYDYDLKFALDVKIGSALRTISPWTVCILSELSNVLREILPDNLWLMADAGGVVGAGEDFNQAKHISCVFRENLGRRALELNETIVVTGALQEIPPGTTECNAALVFGLETEQQKMDWFSKYTEGLVNAFISPVITHGVAFEAHAQNVLCRVNRSSGEITGWATRDLGSIKIHMPTLAQSGYELFSAIEGSFVPSYDEEETWRIIQFCLIQNHLNVFIYRLGVERAAAWTMVREKLDALFARMQQYENAQRLRDFLFAPTVPMKAFMVMKFSQKARTYDYREVGNVLVEKAGASPRAIEGVKTNKASTHGRDEDDKLEHSRVTVAAVEGV